MGTFIRIGEALLKEGLITVEELNSAIETQEKLQGRLGDIVVNKGFVTKEKITPFLAKYFDIPYLNLKDNYKDIKAEVIKLVPENLARRFTVLPVSLEDHTLTIAMFDPLNFMAVDTIKIKTGLKIRRVFASESEISASIEYCYHQDD
jgi:type IV pilus assembly protein PilB